MTKREMFAQVVEIVKTADVDNRDDLISALEHEIELISSRSAHKTPTKTQKENEVIMDTICEVLANCDNPISVTDLMGFDALAGHSNQKLSALLRKLVANGKVTKTIEGKKARFALA